MLEPMFVPFLMVQIIIFGWLVGWLGGWLVCWLVGWWVGWLVGGLVGWLVKGLTAVAVVHRHNQLYQQISEITLFDV